MNRAIFRKHQSDTQWLRSYMNRRHHSRIFCPECQTEQKWEDINFAYWFPCRGCKVNLHFNPNQARIEWLIGLVISFVILVVIRGGWAFSLLIFWPSSVLIGVLVGIVWVVV